MTSPPRHKPSFELRLIVLNAVDYAPGNTIRERIRQVAAQRFTDPLTGCEHQFTWRTISTWLYRFKKNGMTALDNKTRADKNGYRKIQPNELAEAIDQILPALRPNKGGIIPKSVLYRALLQQGFFERRQLAPTTFYRLIRENDLLNTDTCQKLRLSFAMQFANELWQADTLESSCPNKFV